jgi:hypothetical protein
MPPSWRETARFVVIGAAVAGWLVLAVLVLSHEVFVSNDSLNNYAHVWYISEALRATGTLPFKMPVLGHGEALAYPYGFIPWTLAAFARLAGGDWMVTLTLVAGAALLLATTYWALPELRSADMAPLVLFNPFLVESFILAQLPFLWAAAFLFAAVALWRRGRVVLAVLAAAASQVTHPAVMMPIAGLLVLTALPFEQDRPRLLAAYAASAALAMPAAVVLLLSPTLDETGATSAVMNLLGTVGVRCLVFVLPIACAAWGRRVPRRLTPLASAVLVFLLLLMVPVRKDGFAWEALVRRPDHVARQLTQSDEFRPGAVYRVLRAHDGKVSMYDVLLAGGRLDSEFFPESMHRRSFAGVDAYHRFLARRRVDFVVVFDSYTARFHTNEHLLLQECARSGVASVVFRGRGFTVYQVARLEAPHQETPADERSAARVAGVPMVRSSPSSSGVGRGR